MPPNILLMSGTGDSAPYGSRIHACSLHVRGPCNPLNCMANS